ncbi:right-handed parallel beta-helix repeat-containing protein [uncultured Dokdonia sp.]|uniref:right-handed parallel beta-helix repeat-containing protein n=1 Tax=uncultured Dokdonia sp. TaxID=575653 RepID=UPI002618D2C1|nr:right-handed parallel beta-helix repeat-containing protein [uncultured Dokdonia sp.]
MSRISKTSTVILLVVLLQAISCSSTLIPVATENIPTMNEPYPANQDVYDLTTRYRTLIEGNDYTKAINQAIQDAHKAGGGIILFPENRVVEISSVLLMKDRISFDTPKGVTTIKCTDTYTDKQMVAISSKKQLLFRNIRFDGNGKANGIVSYGSDNQNITIASCEFVNFRAPYRRGTGIALQNASSVRIDNCVFKESDFGIRFDKRNKEVYIENNTFEGTLTKNPLRIQGNAITSPEDKRAYSEDIWIRNNTITIGRGDSIIEELDVLTRDAQTGAVDLSLVNGTSDPDYKKYAEWRKGRFAPSGIYLTCGTKELASNDDEPVNHHLNVVIEGNVIEGPDYGFFDGGSADLYSIKDIYNLRCLNNIARNSGDLGFSIERSEKVIVSHNTASRNNSFGIAFSYVKDGLISDNLCEDNALRRNLIYNNIPYGGILITGLSSHNSIKDNDLKSSPITKVSENKDVLKMPFSIRNRPSDFYGISVKTHRLRVNGKIVENTPSYNKIEANQFTGFNWGTIYDQSTSTELKDCFSSSTPPEHTDYPMGTFVLNANANIPVTGWEVTYRVETKLTSEWDGVSSKVKVAVSNSTIQDGDVIGIVLNNGTVYWTVVTDTGIFANSIELKTHTASDVARMGSKVIILRWQEK